jgi:hypothetical protein
MVDLRPNSNKLIERGKGIVMELAGLGYPEAEAMYEASARDVKVAVVIMLRTIFWALPAFIRVEPAIASAPGTTVTTTSTSGRAPSLQRTIAVDAPIDRAAASAPRT